MSEEIKQEVTPVQEDVQVTKEEVKELNEKIENVEQGKLEEAKKEGVESVAPAISELQKELADLKAQNDAIETKQKAEAEEAKLREEIAKQREYQNQINKKHVVAPSENPVAPVPVVEEAPRLSQAQEWALYEKHAGGNYASIDDMEQN